MWYRFNFNPNVEVMGADTQIKGVYYEALFFKNDIKPLFYDQHLKNDYYLDYIELKTTSKITDVIWEYEIKHGLLISKKVFNILKDFNIYDAKYYPAKVVKSNKSYEYYFMRMAGDLTEFIDFKKSVFSWYHSDRSESEVITFNDIDEFSTKKKEVGLIDSINPVEVYFNKEFIDLKYDMIFIGRLNTIAFWINERLKKRLEEENVIGFEFEQNEYLMNGSE